MPEIRVDPRRGETNRAVRKGLRAFNDGFLPKNRKSKPLAISLREGEMIVGGVVAKTYFEWCFIELLWIDAVHRSGGVGAKLMAALDGEARRRGVRHIHVDTLSFQARGFYVKMGYREWGRLIDHPVKGCDDFRMIKDL